MDTTPTHGIPIISTVFLDSILSAMIPPPDDDSRCLFAISLIYAIMNNTGINPCLLEAFSLKLVKVLTLLYLTCHLYFKRTMKRSIICIMSW